MTPDPAPEPSSIGATAAEIRILRSADDTGRIPFPEGSHRAIAVFLQALTQLTERGHVEQDMREGFLGCFLTKSGQRLRDQVMSAGERAITELQTTTESS